MSNSLLPCGLLPAPTRALANRISKTPSDGTGFRKRRRKRPAIAFQEIAGDVEAVVRELGWSLLDPAIVDDRIGGASIDEDRSGEMREAWKISAAANASAGGSGIARHSAVGDGSETGDADGIGGYPMRGNAAA